MYIYIEPVESNHRDGPTGYTKKRKDNYMRIIQLKTLSFYTKTILTDNSAAPPLGIPYSFSLRLVF